MTEYKGVFPIEVPSEKHHAIICKAGWWRFLTVPLIVLSVCISVITIFYVVTK